MLITLLHIPYSEGGKHSARYRELVESLNEEIKFPRERYFCISWDNKNSLGLSCSIFCVNNFPSIPQTSM